MSATAEPAITTLEAAREALAIAEARVAAVNVAIDAGDPDVTADDLLRAEAELRIATSRHAVAERWAAAKAEQDRQQQIAAFRTELPKRLDQGALEKARQKMAAAVEAWVAACAGYDQERSAALSEARELAPLPPGLRENAPRWGDLSDGATVYRPAPCQRSIAEAAQAAVRRHYPRSEIRLDQPQD